MSRAKIIDHYLQKLEDPDFEILQIRKELKSADIPDEEISAIFRIVDNELQRRLRVKNELSKAKSLQYIGAFIFLIGVVITTGTYLGIIPMGKSYALMYGPMGAGASTYLYGLAQRDNSNRQSKFNKKR